MGFDLNSCLLLMHRYIRLLEWELIRIRNSGSDSEKLTIRFNRIQNIWERCFQFSDMKFFPNPFLEDHYGSSFADLVQSFRFPLRPFHQENSKHLLSPNPVEPHGRHLCLSVGFAVCCIDLMESREEPECSSSPGYVGPPLPIISTLSMLEEGFPVSMGLFKIGSGAYMIGGKELPRLSKHDKLPECLWDPDTYDLIQAKYGVEGTSRRTCYLSLEDDDDRCLSRLSLYECDIIPPLTTPKIWPIVERIGNHIHVIDSVPYFDHGQTGPPSHEVLDLDDLRSGWTELSHPAAGLDTYISKHIVVGDRIFAMLYRDDTMVLDCKTNKWGFLDDLCPELRDNMYVWRGPHHYIRHVAGIFPEGFGRCVDGVLPPELKDIYDVVIAVGPLNWDTMDEDRKEVIAVAYLVNKRGEVVRLMHLQNFFDKVNQPFFGFQGMVIPVDEDEKTWCVIYEGITCANPGKHFIFISIFGLEDAIVDPDLRNKSDDYPRESNFIKLNVKESYVYDKETVSKAFDRVNVEVSGAFFL